MKLIVISLGTARRGQLLDDMRRAAAEGWSVDLMVTKESPWSERPPSVRLHAISDHEARHPILKTERFLVLRLPKKLYLAGARILSAGGRLPWLPGRWFRRAQGPWKRRWVATRERMDQFHKETWGRRYADVRPFVLWRTARRHVTPTVLREAAPDLLIVGDGLSSPTGWQLARRYPAAGVGFTLDEALSDRATRIGAGQVGTRPAASGGVLDSKAS